MDLYKRVKVGTRVVVLPSGLPEGQRPHPRRPNRGCMYLQDTADYSAIGNHVIVVIIPLAGWAAC
jgi:hypothetical protein